MRRFLTPVAAMAAVFLLAALPDVLTIENDRVVLHLSMFAADIGGYFRGLLGGDSFLYRPAYTNVPYRSVLSDIVRPFLTSFAYAGVSAVTAMLIGAIGGMLVVAYRKEQVKDVVSLFGIVPDFVMILLLQLIVVAMYKATGIHVARVATITQDEPALLLPLLILTLIPAVFILRSISNRTYMVTTEEFVLVARAQGYEPLRRLQAPHPPSRPCRPAGRPAQDDRPRAGKPLHHRVPLQHPGRHAPGLLLQQELAATSSTWW